jgi:hypothetical protein
MVAEGVTAEPSLHLYRISQSKVEECGCSSIETVTFRADTLGLLLLLLRVHLFWLFIWVLSGNHAAAAEPITPTRFVLLFVLLFWRWCAFLSSTSRATLVCSLHWASAEEEEQYAYNEYADYRHHWRNDLGVCDGESCGLSCSLDGGRKWEEWGWKKQGGKWRRKGKERKERGRHGGEEKGNEGMEKKSQLSRRAGNSRGSMVEVIVGIEEGGIGEPSIYNFPFKLTCNSEQSAG